MFAHNRGNSLARDELCQPLLRGGGQYVICCQLQVQSFLLQQPFHQREQLDNELVLAHIIAVLEDDRILRVVGASKVEQQGEHVRLEHRTFLSDDSGDGELRIERQRQGSD